MPNTRILIGPGTYDVTIDGAPTQITVPVLTAGTIAEATPKIGDALTITGSNASASATFQWQRDGADIAGATASVYDTTGQPSGTYRRGVRDGIQGPVYTLDAIVSAPDGDVATHMGAQDRPTTNNVQPTTTIDVSGFSAGDTIFWVFASPSILANPTNARVNGNAATEVHLFNLGGSGHGGIFSYTLQQADIDAEILTVGVDLISTAFAYRVAFDFVHSPTATISDFNVVANGTENTIMITSTRNTVYHFAYGPAARFSGAGLTYTGVIPSTIYNEAVDLNGYAAGIAQNAPIGANEVTFSIDGAGGYMHIALAIEGHQ